MSGTDEDNKPVYHQDVEQVLADVNKVHTSILNYDGHSAPNAMVEQSVDAVLDAYKTITAGMPPMPASFIQLNDESPDRPSDYTVL